MRQGSNHRRGGRGGGRHGGGHQGGGNGGYMRRGNGGGNGGTPQSLRHQIFDSNCPSGIRVKGNAFQVYEKYVALARDCGDRIEAEGYWQHAEHYSRIIAVINEMEAQHRARFAAEQPVDGAGAPVQPVAEGEAAPAEEAQVRHTRPVAVPVFDGDMGEEPPQQMAAAV